METEPIEAFVFDPKQIPTEPGCYLFYDKNDEIIYVGKAKNIRKRTSSYFQKTKKSPKTESLVKKICRIDTRTVSTEMEALILENSLIKQHRPKYNILLRDDKNFLYLRVTSEEEPKMELTRRLVRDGSTYIGPRTSSKSFRKTIAFCQKFFGVKMVNASYDNYVSKLKGKELSLEDYKDNIRRMKKFLRGDTKEVIAEVKERMMAFAKDRNFEAAAKMRDLLIAIDGSTKRQTIEFTGDFTARDFVHFHRDKNKAYFVRMVFRNGKFVDLNEIKFRAEEFATDSELVKQFLLQFYPQVDTLPKEIFVPALPEDLETVIEFLMNQSSRRDKSSFVSIEDHKNTLNISHDNKDATNRVSSKLTIHVPERGDKRKVLEIASTNAQNFAAKAHITALSQAENFAKALPELTDFLGLEQPIRRIECYDISHFSGQQTVGSQVTFIDGQPYKNAYRRYKIESLAPGKIDDFASMQEVLGRRFARLIEENNNKRHSELDSESSISLKPVKTDDDWKFYHDFGKKLFALVFPNIEYNEKHPDLIYNKNHPFLVINSGKAIGSFRLDEKAEARIILRTFFISESERNKSFGTQVLQQVEAWCLDREKKSLVSNAHSDAVSFYEKNGFKLNFWKGDSGNDKCVPMGKIIKKETGKTIIKKLETEAEKKLALTFAAEIFGPMGWSTNIEEKKLDETKNSIWAAYKDEKMIGMLRAGKFVNTWWNLKDLAIGTENRRQGIGTKLIDEAKTHILKQAGKKLFVISAKDSINFYEAYGFQINEKPIKKIAAYITKEKEDNEEKTETIWQSYELKIEPKKTEKNIPEYPDLIVIDGGKGQLSSVLKILDPIMKSIDFDQNKEASWNFDITKNVIALAKREEEVFRGTVNEKNKVEFEQLDINANSAASKLLQRTRDEAHRFAITFNRNLRAKAAMKSILDEIPGIGGRSKKKLLQTFGSVSGIREASDEEILGIVTQKQLESLRKQL